MTSDSIKVFVPATICLLIATVLFAKLSALYTNWVVVGLTVFLLCLAVHLITKWLLRAFVDPRAKQQIQTAFFIGLSLRIAIALVLYWALTSSIWPGTPGVFFDDEGFHTLLPTTTSLNGWSDIWTQSIERGPHILYLIYTYTIYFVFGESNLVVRLLSSVLAALLIPIGARLALELVAEREGTKLPVLTAWLIALSPELILYSVAVLREWAIALVLSAAVLITLRLVSTRLNPILVLSLGVSIAALIVLRIPAALLLLGVFGIWTFMELLRKGDRAKAILISLTVVLVPFVGIMEIAHEMGAVQYSPLEFEGWTFLISQRYLEGERVATRLGASIAQYGSFLESSGTFFEPVGWALAAVKRFVSPSPLWFPAVGTFSTLVFLLPGLFWYGLMPALAIGSAFYARGITSNRLLILLVAGVFLAFTLSPLGLAHEPLRARIQILPFIYIISAYGILILQERPGFRGNVIVLTTVIYVAMALFYYLGLLLPWPVLHPYSLSVMGVIALLAAAIAATRVGGVWQFLRIGKLG